MLTNPLEGTHATSTDWGATGSKGEACRGVSGLSPVIREIRVPSNSVIRVRVQTVIREIRVP